MTEGIEYTPTGTVEVTIDEETYKLGRPKLKQWRYFTRRIDEMTTEAQETLNVLAGAAQVANDMYEADPTDENKAVKELAEQELQKFAATPFYETSSQLVRQMFEQLGDKPLPADLDDWPAWLAADVTLPGQILTHWRKAPKASGLNGAG